MEVLSSLQRSTVNLSHQQLTSDDLLRLAQRIKGSSENITTIKLGYNELKDEGAKIVASLLSQHRSITCLDLGFCQIGDEGVEALAKSLTFNTSIQILYLSGNLITEVGFKHLGNALHANKSLTTLYLTGNSGKADGAKHIAKGLKFNHSITKLFVNGNKIEKEGASSISDTLIANHSITHLNMSDNGIGDAGLMSLSEAMANNRNIEDLELSFNRITSVGIGNFIDSIIGYQQIRRLLLDNNKLGDAGAKSLALALPHMSLTELNIGFNEIGAEGLQAIISFLSHPQGTITSITLSGNIIDNNVAKELANMLVTNCNLAALYIDRTNLTSVGERFVATGIASNKTSSLRVLTGFELGKILALLGSPPSVSAMSNENALRYLAQVWRDLERSSMLAMPSSSSEYGNGYHEMSNGGIGGGSTSHSSADVAAATVTSRDRLSPPPGMMGGIIYSNGQPNRSSAPSPSNNGASQNNGNGRRSTRSSTKAAAAQASNASSARQTPVNNHEFYVQQYGMLLESLRRLREVPFDPRELQELSIWYYSPPPMEEDAFAFERPTAVVSGTTVGSQSTARPSTPVNNDDSSAIPSTAGVKAAHDRPSGLNDSPRPHKRAGNRNTVPRIMYYSRVKGLLDEFQCVANRHQECLMILRQLRLLEISLPVLDPQELEELLLREVVDPILSGRR